MDRILTIARTIISKAEDLLQGEPLRVIGYGAAVVIWLVCNASGRFADISFDSALALTVSAAATLTAILETARRFVYSPNTVAVVAAAAYAAGADEVPVPIPSSGALPGIDLDA